MKLINYKPIVFGFSAAFFAGSMLYATDSAVLLVEAESYVSEVGDGDIRTEDTGDVDGGGQNVGYINDGDGMDYSIDVPVDGNYNIEYRVAAKSGSGKQIDLKLGETVLDSVVFDATGDWQTYTTVTSGTSVALTAGVQTVQALATVGDFNFNWFSLTEVPDPATLLVEAESYVSEVGDGDIRVEANGDIDAGQNVGYINDGDGMDYSIDVPVDGNYTIEYRVAAKSGSGKQIDLKLGETVLDTVVFDATGDWQTYATVTSGTPVALTAGVQTVQALATVGGFNFNWFNLTQVIGFVDSDSDGVADDEDAFPNDPAESVDTDGDGTGNNADTDDDNDGVEDSADAFPLDAAESVDTDGDGTGNEADTDDDNDGVEDGADVFPLDASESADTDSDGVGDNADVFPEDATETVDFDGDGVGDNADTDDDGDGVDDTSDAFPYDATESADTDSDGVGDNADAFPEDATETLDTDGDGVGNNADTDDDGDGVDDDSDDLPLDPTDSVDSDSDGVGDSSDEFPNDASEDSDFDKDGIGDNSDEDQDLNLTEELTFSGNENPFWRMVRLHQGTLNITGGILEADKSDLWDCFVATGGNTATLNQSGGDVTLNFIEIARAAGDTGTYNLSGGALTLPATSRKGGYNFFIGGGDGGAGGAGTFEITGGSIQTRAGVELVSGEAVFSVVGSDASEIGIGAYGDGDGAWLQQAGSTLKVEIDDAGLTPIVIADVDASGDGANVEFAAGALLDVRGTENGTWTVMEFTGTVTDNGLAFADTVDEFWSFAFEDLDSSGTPEVLTVTRDAPMLLVEAESYTSEVGDGDIRVEANGDVDAGQNVGYINDGDGMGYEIDIPVNGTYRIEYRVAGKAGTTGRQIDLKAGDDIIDTIVFPSAGGWQTYETHSSGNGVKLSAGVQSLQVLATVGDFNFNWFKFTLLEVSTDVDSDNDGVFDEDDAFPNDASEQYDFDEDGTGDNADTDDDNDGVEDGDDAFPFNAAEWSDLDQDGIGDNEDADDDGDGVFDVDEVSPQFVNISTRAYVLDGDKVMIAGFVIEGTDDVKVLIQGVGAELDDDPFFVEGNMLDTVIGLYDVDGALIVGNDDWDADSTEATANAEANDATGAFVLTNDSKSSAIVTTLSPGVYTVVLNGKDNTGGVALIEVYDVSSTEAK